MPIAGWMSRRSSFASREWCRCYGGSASEAWFPCRAVGRRGSCRQALSAAVPSGAAMLPHRHPYRASMLGAGTMFYTVGFENVTRCAIAALCWSRRCPYTRIANAPPSLWPSQCATVGTSLANEPASHAESCEVHFRLGRGGRVAEGGGLLNRYTG